MTSGKLKARDMTYAAICAVLMAVCSWISIPSVVPFTLQTFAVFLTCALLGGRLGFFSIAAYILLGAVGLPVFSGFKGGLGALLGPTGGYIVGFICMALVYWAITSRFGSGLAVSIISMALGLIVCCAFGTAWFMVAYTRANGAVALSTALMWCVVPYLLPDAVKLALAVLLANRLRRGTRLFVK